MKKNIDSIFPRNKEVDISMELWRAYLFLSVNGVPYELKIEAPSKVLVTTNGHRLTTKGGIAHYVPVGWIDMYWENIDKDKYQHDHQR